MTDRILLAGTQYVYSDYLFIIYLQILELQNVKALPLDPLFNPRKEGFANFELSIQRNTKVIFHGVHNQVSSQKVVIDLIPIKYAAAYKGSSGV